jgi:hypothetical protein
MKNIKSKISSVASSMVMAFSFMTVANAADFHETSIKKSSCKKAPAEIATRLSVPQNDVLECDAPKGYRLFQVSEGPTSWLAIESKKSQALWAMKNLNASSSVKFPQVNGNSVGWRVSDSGQTKMAFGITGLNPSNAKNTVNLTFMFFENPKGANLCRDYSESDCFALSPL